MIPRTVSLDYSGSPIICSRAATDCSGTHRAAIDCSITHRAATDCSGTHRAATDCTCRSPTPHCHDRHCYGTDTPTHRQVTDTLDANIGVDGNSSPQLSRPDFMCHRLFDANWSRKRVSDSHVNNRNCGSDKNVRLYSSSVRLIRGNNIESCKLFSSSGHGPVAVTRSFYSSTDKSSCSDSPVRALSLAGCGFLAPYLLGSVMCLQDNNFWLSQHKLGNRVGIVGESSASDELLLPHLVGYNTRNNEKQSILLRNNVYLGNQQAAFNAASSYGGENVPFLIAGASAGALLGATMLAGQPSFKTLWEFFNSAAEDCYNYTLGAFNINFVMEKYIRECMEQLPADAHITLSGRLFISVTHAKTFQNHIISEFYSREDLIHCLLCSCYLPVFSGWELPKFRGKKYIDGGFTNNQPNPFDASVRCLTVSPFARSANICPADDSGSPDISPEDDSGSPDISTADDSGSAVISPADDSLFKSPVFITRANESLLVSRDNAVRHYHALVPRSKERLQKLYEDGYQRTLEYLRLRNYKVSCTSYNHDWLLKNESA